MCNITLDSWFVFIEYKWEIIVFFVCAFGLGSTQLRLLTKNKLDPVLNLCISFGVGCITLTIFSYVLVFGAYFWPPVLMVGSYLILFFIVVVFICNLWAHGSTEILNYKSAVMGICLLILLTFRLAFLRHIILPPYSDSPIHYQVILGLLNPEKNYNAKLSLGNIFTSYYHFGFHGMAAWLVKVTNLDPLDVMPLLGQLFLILAPVSVAGLTYAVSDSSRAALFAGLMSAVGWLMPAFSVNWGKYPAVMAIALFPVVLTLPKLFEYCKDKKSLFLIYSLILILGITLIHTRIIVCLSLAAMSYFISSRLLGKEEIGFFQSIRFSILFGVSLWPLFPLLTDFYNEILIWFVLLTLLPFAFQYHARISTAIFFYVFGLWLITFIPTTLKMNTRELLDRQFVEMMLYIPFSLLGGVGFAGLIKKIELNIVLKWAVTMVFVGIVIFSFQKNNSFYPDSCCNYFTEDDRLAFQWIQENTSVHTLFITSAFKDGDKIYGTDAGVWIYPITQIPINKLPFDTKWNSDIVYHEICSSSGNETYIYAGGNNFSFDQSDLSKETWARSVFQSGKVSIFKIEECKY